MRLERTLATLCLGLLASSASLAESLPQRWISAGGATTEWIVELGGQERLVGVDTTSQHPQTVTSLPSVGYQRQLSAEGVLTLTPDLLLGTEEMGPPPVLAQLERAGIRIVQLSARSDLQVLDDNLQRLGELLGQPERAQLALEDFHQQLSHLQQQVDQARQGEQPPGVLLGQGGTNPLVAGRNTLADWLLRQAGARNLAEHEGYKNLSGEALLALEADWLVLTDRQLRGAGGALSCCCDRVSRRLAKNAVALVTTSPFCFCSNSQCWVERLVRSGVASTSKSPAPTGPAKLTVSDTGSTSRSGCCSTAFSRVAAVEPPKGPTRFSKASLVLPWYRLSERGAGQWPDRRRDGYSLLIVH